MEFAYACHSLKITNFKRGLSITFSLSKMKLRIPNTTPLTKNRRHERIPFWAWTCTRP